MPLLRDYEYCLTREQMLDLLYDYTDWLLDEVAPFGYPYSDRDMCARFLDLDGDLPQPAKEPLLLGVCVLCNAAVSASDPIYTATIYGAHVWICAACAVITPGAAPMLPGARAVALAMAEQQDEEE